MKSKPNRFPVINCPKCQGEGVVPLSDDMEATLQAVTEHAGCTAGEIYLRIKCSVGPTAINQRLEDLRAWGFVRRERQGRAWVYFPDDKGWWE